MTRNRQTPGPSAPPGGRQALKSRNPPLPALCRPPLAESSPISPRAPWARLLATHGLLWTLAALPYAGMLVAEAVRQSAEPRYLAALGQAVATLLPWAISSAGLHVYLMRHAERWTLARLLAAYAIALLLFVLPQEVFQAWLIKWLQGAALPSPAQVLTQLPPFYWLADATLLAATLAGVLGWLAYQRHQEGLEQRHAADAALAASRLQIESLRLASLQAQLEPQSARERARVRRSAGDHLAGAPLPIGYRGVHLRRGALSEGSRLELALSAVRDPRRRIVCAGDHAG